MCGSMSLIENVIMKVGKNGVNRGCACDQHTHHFKSHSFSRQTTKLIQYHYVVALDEGEVCLH